MDQLRFKAKIQAFPDAEGQHFIEVSRSNIMRLGGKFNLRLVCTINGKLAYQCGLQGLGNGAGWIALNQKRMRELGVAKGDTVSVDIKLDKSEYGLPMPAELKELLRQDGESRRRFEQLKPGLRRNILHYVGNAKGTDRRLERALLVIENLKRLDEGEETVVGIFGVRSKFSRYS